MVTLSTCIITKNEGFYIENCLRSIKNISDEIIVVDSGSTDKTLEIVRKYTNKIFQIKWNNNFSEARNESIKYANSDWILYLDADEILDFESSKQIKKYLNFLENKPYILSGNIILPDNTSFIRSVLFKNGYNIEFKGSVHEKLDGKNALYLHNKLIKIYVTRFDDKEEIKEKSKIYSKLLEDSLENENTSLELAYKYRCLAAACNDKNKIEDYFNKSLAIIDKNLDIIDKDFFQGLFSEYIEFLFKIKNYTKALKLSERLIELYPDNYIVGYYMAYSLIRLGKIEDAFDILQSELNNIDNFKDYMIDKKYLKSLINIELARIELLKDEEDNYYSILSLAKNIYSSEEIDFYLFVYLLIKEDLKKSIQYIHSISNSLDINKLIIVSDNYKNERIYYQYIINLLREAKKSNFSLLDKELWLIENKIIELEHKVNNIETKLISVKDNLPNIKIIIKVLNNSSLSQENINKLKYISNDITFISRYEIKNEEYKINKLDYKNNFDIINKIEKDNNIEYLLLINSYEQISENTIIKLPEILEDNKQDILYTKIQNINIDETRNFYSFREFIFRNKENIFSLSNQKDRTYKKLLIYNLSFFFNNFQDDLLNELLLLEKIEIKENIEEIYQYKIIADKYSYHINNYSKAIEYYNKSIDIYKENNLDYSNFYIELLLGIIRCNILLENPNIDKLLNETIDLIPNIPDILFYLSKYKDITGNIKQSIEILNYLDNIFENKSILNISKILSFEQSIRIIIFIDLSKLYKKENNSFLSENFLKRAILESPNSMYINLHLSKFYLLNNEINKSFKYLLNSRFILISEKDKTILKTYLNESKDSENYLELYKFILFNLIKYPYWDKYEKLELREKEFSL